MRFRQWGRKALRSRDVFVVAVFIISSLVQDLTYHLQQRVGAKRTYNDLQGFTYVMHLTPPPMNHLHVFSHQVMHLAYPIDNNLTSVICLWLLIRKWMWWPN